MKQPLRVIIVDDHQLFADGIQQVIDATNGFKVVATCNSGSEALELLCKTPVDLLLLDLKMPGMDGLETARAVKASHPQLRLLIITMLSHTSYIQRLIRTGVEGYILKDSGQEELLTALETIGKGGKYYSKDVTQALIEGMAPRNTRSGLDKVQLTDREHQVLQLVAKQLTTREIARKLFVAESTIITHRKNIMRKLDVSNSVGMVKLATESGLLR